MALSERQKAFLDAYLENPLMSKKAHAERLQIPYKTVISWQSRNANGFKDELESALQAKWEEAKHMASETIFSLAREGDFKAAKYILDYSGYAPAQKIQAEVSQNINITIGE